MFLELVIRLRATGLPLQATVAGAIAPDQAQLVDECRQNDIEFLGHTDNVSDLLAGDWVFCLFSHFEGRPLAVEEAIAAGLPVVVSDLPGARMMLGDDPRVVTTLEQAIDCFGGLKTFDQRRDIAAQQARILEQHRSELPDARMAVSSAYRRYAKLN